MCKGKAQYQPKEGIYASQWFCPKCGTVPDRRPDPFNGVVSGVVSHGNSGRSKPYFFSFSSKEKPGKIIAHCVRIETIEMDISPAFDVTTFTLLGADYDTDKRVQQMIESAKGFRP